MLGSFRCFLAICIVGSIFILGCLFFLSFSTDYVFYETTKETIKSSRNSIEQSYVHWILNNVQNFLHLGTNNNKTLTAEEGCKLRFYKEFPEVSATPRVSSVLDMIYKKLAVHDRQIVNRHDYNYIHNVPGACTGKKIELMVGIPIRVDSFEARQAIRETWGQYGKDPANNAVVLFFLGTHNNQSLQDEINIEAANNGDIIQEDFNDSYRNLSLKTVALMKWVTSFCSESTFFVKVDDDVYINIPFLLMKLHEQLSRGSMFIIGKIYADGVPHRNKNDKWMLTTEEYPGKTFPNYANGPMYAMTTTAAMRLYIESLYLKNLFLEDVYLTGLVADKAAVPRISDVEYLFDNLKPNGCNYRDRISGHGNSPDDVRKIHKELSDSNLSCIENI